MIKVISRREKEVLSELAMGHSVKEIASQLYISPYTVDTHIKNMKKKTASKNLCDLVRKFVISLEDPEQYFKAFIAVVFLALQYGIMFGSLESIKLKPRERIVRCITVGRKN